MAGDSRERMVQSAVALISTRGVSGTSFSDVLEHSGAPRGSIYHHFPDGKRQLAAAAIEAASVWLRHRQLACEIATAADVLDCFVGSWRAVVMASGGASGCAVAGVALDSGPDAIELMDAVRATFRSWVDLLAEQFVAAGLADDRAQALATTTLASMEGALVLCRAEGGPEPLDIVAGELARLLG